MIVVVKIALPKSTFPHNMMASNSQRRSPTYLVHTASAHLRKLLTFLAVCVTYSYYCTARTIDIGVSVEQQPRHILAAFHYA